MLGDAYLILFGEAKLVTDTKGPLGVLDQILLLRLLYSSCAQANFQVWLFAEALTASTSSAAAVEGMRA